MEGVANNPTTAGGSKLISSPVLWAVLAAGSLSAAEATRAATAVPAGLVGRW